MSGRPKPQVMNIEMAAVDGLVGDPRNVRLHDEANILSIMASYREYGQQKPIVLDADGVVIAGNGQLEAARRLGWSTIAVKRSDLSGARAAGYAIADNRTAETARWDEPSLAAQLEEIRNSEIDLESTGFSSRDIDVMIARIADEIADARDDSAGDSDSDGDVEEESGPEGEGRPAAKAAVYPLAIVLDRPAWNRWQAIKEDRGLKRDAELLIALMDDAS